MKSKIDIERPVTVTDLYKKKLDVLRFDGLWEMAIGKPEVRGSWIIWGESSSGKTRFGLQLAKYLTQFGKVLYDSLEEGLSESLRQSFKAERMEDVKQNIHLLDKEKMPELVKRLGLRKSAKFVMIDSIQYTFMDIETYKRLLETFPDKLFIFISHSKGKDPKGSLAESVRYDANVKIYIEGYKAFIKSRYKGITEDYVIWHEGAENYWGQNLKE